MLESTSGTCAFEVPRTGNRHQPFFGGCPRGVRNWKQACPFFSELPRVEFRVEFGTGNRHVPFFRSCPAWSSAWSSQSWGDNRIEGGSAPRLPSWGCEGTAGCPAASETPGGLLPGRADGGHVLPRVGQQVDLGARVVVPKGHKRAHEFREGARVCTVG